MYRSIEMEVLLQKPIVCPSFFRSILLYKVRGIEIHNDFVVRDCLLMNVEVITLRQ